MTNPSLSKLIYFSRIIEFSMNPTLVLFLFHGLAMFYLYPNGTGPPGRRLSTSSWQRSFPVVRHVQSPRMMMTTVMRRIHKPKKMLQLSESSLTLKRGVNHGGMTTQAPLPNHTAGVRAWARIHPKNSERDVQKVVQNQGTTQIRRTKV